MNLNTENVRLLLNILDSFDALYESLSPFQSRPKIATLMTQVQAGKAKVYEVIRDLLAEGTA